MKKALLADQITAAFFHMDPYNGADYEDVYMVTLKELDTVEGCRNILEELSALIMN